MGKIVVAGQCHDIFIQQFKDLDKEVILSPEISYNQLLEIAPEMEGIVATTRTAIDHKLIDAASGLKWIGRLGSGMDLIDTEYAETKGISCINSPEGNCNAVAEHVMGILLNLKNKITNSYQEIKNGEWNRDKNRGDEIFGSTVGIIGFGNTGRTLSEKLRGFNVKILAYDKYLTDFGNEYVSESNMEAIQQQADIISFHVPLTEETFHYANEAFFNSLAKKPYFINACRGRVTDTVALINALKNGQIKAAGLD
ncbi:MAG: NAD(P)-dependent oxidoreductase, partial [Bacteroidota bacterium]